MLNWSVASFLSPEYDSWVSIAVGTIIANLKEFRLTILRLCSMNVAKRLILLFAHGYFWKIYPTSSEGSAFMSTYGGFPITASKPPDFTISENPVFQSKAFTR